MRTPIIASTLGIALALATSTTAQTTVPWTTTGWTDFGTTNVTGVTGNFLPGWTTLQSTPDLGDDLFFNPSQSLSGADDDAGLWFLQFAVGSSSPASNEVAQLSLSGFTPGQSYTLEFFATIMEYSFAGWSGAADEIDVTLTGADIATWQTTTLEDLGDADNMNEWIPQSLTFTALSGTVEFAFNDNPTAPDPANVARFGIDGIRVIPAPGSAVLLAAGALTAARRQRSSLVSAAANR
ncbi:MAG: hypothetical protein AAFS11_09680 [Planctomycetota bacterium]